MSKHPKTNGELLHRIRDANDFEAWVEFERIYRPVIHRVASTLGLQDADSRNVVQEVFVKVEGAIVNWRPGQPQGSFRKWLRTIARNSAIDVIRRRRPDSPVGGTTAQSHLRSVAVQDAVLSHLRIELEREAFRWAANRIQIEFTPATWDAFWQTMVASESCSSYAERVGKSIGSIYTARSRVIRRLQAEVELFDWNANSEGEDAE